MARYTGPSCRICRREGEKLFLKGRRCYTDRCAFERRGYAPGQHGQRRPKTTDYGIQLREKQKVRKTYGMMEKQFRRFFREAERQKGITGDNLLILLERRFDNVIYRAGFASSRSQARQLVRHGHFSVDKKKVNIPSALIKEGAKIEVHPRSKNNGQINMALQAGSDRPEWLDVDEDKMTAVLKRLPVREDIVTPVQEQLIVELYSK